MSEYLINESEIVQVADAIRAKSETTEPLSFPQGFVDAVSSIQSGGEDTLKKLLDANKSCSSMFYSSKLTNFDGLISFQSTSSVTTMSSMFSSCSNLTTIPLLDTSSVTDMSYMFNSCSNLTTIPLLDTSNVTNMSGMFYCCSRLTTIPLLDTSSVTNMSYMLSYCLNLTTIPLLDTSNVTNMASMFRECSNLTTIPLLDTSSVTNTSYMFYHCTKLTVVSSLDISNLTDMSSMFEGCFNLTECWIRNIKTNLTVGSGSSYGHLLTVESLVHLINELINVNSSRTLTVGIVNLRKLASVYVKTIEITDEMRVEDKYIDQKSPCVVCESTDEGATLITDYAKTKNWTIK